MHGGNLSFPQDWVSLLVLMLVGAIASAINAVAGGGSLVSFPMLTGVNIGSLRIGYNIPMRVANATNSAGLWPGSLSSAFGFLNLLSKSSKYLKTLWFPTVLGSVIGAFLLIESPESVFGKVVPALILMATCLLAFQGKVKAWANKHQHTISHGGAFCLQLLVSIYGGYFGAGMGIMMLAVFTIYMEGNIHELNAVKAWLGTIINLVCSTVFFAKGLVLLWPFLAIMIGALIGGYAAALVSQKVDPNKLRVAIACYGFLTAGYFAWTNWIR
ncbi:MAG TPA: sulfite exporter TauE/SafE family protein [Fimbriimonadaceae bacterium]|jgi:hypothetical protein